MNMTITNGNPTYLKYTNEQIKLLKWTFKKGNLYFSTRDFI